MLNENIFKLTSRIAFHPNGQHGRKGGTVAIDQQNRIKLARWQHFEPKNSTPVRKQFVDAHPVYVHMYMLIPPELRHSSTLILCKPHSTIRLSYQGNTCRVPIWWLIPLKVDLADDSDGSFRLKATTISCHQETFFRIPPTSCLPNLWLHTTNKFLQQFYNK